MACTSETTSYAFSEDSKGQTETRAYDFSSSDAWRRQATKPQQPGPNHTAREGLSSELGRPLQVKVVVKVSCGIDKSRAP